MDYQRFHAASRALSHCIVIDVTSFKDASIFNDSSGIRDDTLIHSINMLLQYVGSDHQGFNAGFDYVDDTEDISSLKSTFEKIFEAMGQDQHYRMMMDTVKV